MTNDMCDILCAVSEKPGRRMMVSELKTTQLLVSALPSLLREGHLVYFYGGWVAVTDRGYDAMILHCAENF